MELKVYSNRASLTVVALRLVLLEQKMNDLLNIVNGDVFFLVVFVNKLLEIL